MVGDGIFSLMPYWVSWRLICLELRYRDFNLLFMGWRITNPNTTYSASLLENINLGETLFSEKISIGTLVTHAYKYSFPYLLCGRKTARASADNCHAANGSKTSHANCNKIGCYVPTLDILGGFHAQIVPREH